LFRRFRILLADPLLALLVVALSVFGVAMVYSAGAVEIARDPAIGAWRRQALWVAVSIATALVLLRYVSLGWLSRMAVPAYVLSVLMLVAVLFIGVGHGIAQHTRRWLDLGVILIQPAQFANLAAVIMLAHMVGRWRTPPDSLLRLWKPIAVVAVPSLLVMMQPDLGTALVFGAILLGALYWGGTPAGILFMLLAPGIGLILAFQPWLFALYMIGLSAFVIFYRPKKIDAAIVLAATLAAGTVAVPMWESLAPYQQNRILVFMNPNLDPLGAGYQVIQSQVAIGAGGLTGQGFLGGSQKRFGFLPERHTDLIFSVVGEELGFLGSMAVLLAFLAVLWRLVRIAERSSDPFAGTIAFGVFSVWAMHLLVNVGMTTGVMPVTGLPLPFLSYGGSFMIATFMALAFVERVAAEQKKRVPRVLAPRPLPGLAAR
jgi:rod shape determining protein RodA